MRMPWRFVELPRTVWFAAVVEAIGILLVFAGLWIIHPIAAIIGAGLFFILVAQGIQRGD
tara:strand:+ start:359 stop:538 length:180 start_codon:yes stop_codon:yes gene_type:complete